MDNMNHTVSKAGAAIVTISVLLFAICMLIPFDFGSYFVCIFLSIGYVIMSAGFWNESDGDYKATATTGIIFAAIYAVIIMLVYFTQTTTVMLRGVFESMQAEGFPAEIITSIGNSLDCNPVFRGSAVSPATMMLIMLMSIIVMGGIYLLITMKPEKK